MVQEDITFRRFLGLESLLGGKKFDEAMWQGYIKLSSYVLNHEHINIVSVNDISVLEKLALKLENDKQSISEDTSLRACALMMMHRFIDYKIYVLNKSSHDSK